MARYYNSKKNGKDARLMDYMSGLEGRKRMEMEGSDMIHEDHNAIANLPQNVMMKEFPKTDYFMYNLNDDIKGIDVQIDDDVRKEKRKVGQPYPEKY